MQSTGQAASEPQEVWVRDPQRQEEREEGLGDGGKEEERCLGMQHGVVGSAKLCAVVFGGRNLT